MDMGDLEKCLQQATDAGARIKVRSAVHCVGADCGCGFASSLPQLAAPLSFHCALTSKPCSWLSPMACSPWTGTSRRWTRSCRSLTSELAGMPGGWWHKQVSTRAGALSGLAMQSAKRQVAVHVMPRPPVHLAHVRFPGTYLFVDECHATGFLGKTGRGTDEHCGVHGRVDIINSTLGKALGGATGVKALDIDKALCMTCSMHVFGVQISI